MRKNELWTLEINDILFANLKCLKKLYAYYFEPNRHHMTLNDAISLTLKDTGLNLNEKDTIFCFGMSKMTNIIEIGNREKYYKLEFVEFLEFICRIAKMRPNT